MWPSIRIAVLLSAAGLVLGAAPAVAEPAVHLHESSAHPASGSFVCGDLTLTINGGTETEVMQGTLINGVIRLSLHRFWTDVTLAGSDGQTYRAEGVTTARFVLVEPDDETPVTGHELIVTRFVGGTSDPPLSLREEFRWIDGVETPHQVTGSCGYGP